MRSFVNVLTSLAAVLFWINWKALIVYIVWRHKNQEQFASQMRSLMESRGEKGKTGPKPQSPNLRCHFSNPAVLSPEILTRNFQEIRKTERIQREFHLYHTKLEKMEPESSSKNFLLFHFVFSLTGSSIWFPGNMIWVHKIDDLEPI